MTKEQMLFIQTWKTYLNRFRNMSDEVRTVIACQFALESDFGSSRLAKENNNICGMKIPLVRPTTQIGTKGFASYQNQTQCVIDFMLCLAFHQLGTRELENINYYLNNIKKWYCLDKGYTENIKSIYSQFQNFYKNEQQN